MTPRERLLGWYDVHGRDLPWRRSRDPWAVWVSEIMLQQTRVETAIPYYDRFLERFPTPSHLAAATSEEVLSSWSGLGYYRRARNLQRAAADLDRRGQPIPATVAGLRELPGIGPYTAAAIASIAFGVNVPVLDGNVERLISRLLAEEGPIEARATRERLLERGAELLDGSRPGDSNQALMELGATICLPRSPRCGECPLAQECRARAEGTAERFPVKRRGSAIQRVSQVAAVVEREGRILLFRRDEAERQLAGLWELPLVEAGDPAEAALALAHRFGGEWSLGEKLLAVRHSITTRSCEISVHRASCRHPEPEIREAPEAGWFASASVGSLALSGASRKLLARLAASDRS